MAGTDPGLGETMRARRFPVDSAILNVSVRNGISLIGSPRRVTRSSTLMPKYTLRARATYWNFRNSGLAAIGNAATSKLMTGCRKFFRKKFFRLNWWINDFTTWTPAFVR
jgi:hypothetical protein